MHQIVLEIKSRIEDRPDGSELNATSIELTTMIRAVDIRGAIESETLAEAMAIEIGTTIGVGEFLRDVMMYYQRLQDDLELLAGDNPKDIARKVLTLLQDSAALYASEVYDKGAAPSVEHRESTPDWNEMFAYLAKNRNDESKEGDE